jgi:Domain of unknown function (DUF5666)
MMNDQLVNALDQCLLRMDQGSDLESCLAYYPEYATELRPLLLAALDAESITEKDVPVEVVRRGKTKLLNVAAEMREQGVSKRIFGFLPLRRAIRLGFAALIAVVLIAGIGGTGLVSASSSSLPGDQLYSIKLKWEDLQLKLALAQPEREVLQDKFDQERVQEINTLISSKRLEIVKFSGQIEGILPNQIIVSGVNVVIAPDTKIDGNIQMGAWAHVEGQTQLDGGVTADKIKVDSSKSEDNSNTPGDNTNSPPGGRDSNHGNNKSGDGKSGKTELPEIDQTKTPNPESSGTIVPMVSPPRKDKATPEIKQFEIEGTVDNYSGGIIEVAGKSIYIVPETQLQESPTNGSRVFIRGYVNQNGEFVALNIDVKPSSNSNDSGGQNGDRNPNHSGEERTRTPEPGEKPGH